MHGPAGLQSGLLPSGYGAGPRPAGGPRGRVSCGEAAGEKGFVGVHGLAGPRADLRRCCDGPCLAGIEVRGVHRAVLEIEDLPRLPAYHDVADATLHHRLDLARFEVERGNTV